jgi:hypothetical protein
MKWRKIGGSVPEAAVGPGVAISVIGGIYTA